MLAAVLSGGMAKAHRATRGEFATSFRGDYLVA